MKNISILGSTGSIGTQTLDVVRKYSNKLKVVGLAAGRNVNLLNKQILEFTPKIFSHENSDTTACDVATHPDVELVVAAIVGSAGLIPTAAAIDAGKDVALANKESLVCAGDIIMEKVQKNGVRLLPVDSEHCAISECLYGRKPSDIKRIILTASGGPFFGKTKSELKDITPENALKHPNWNMGAKISIDSATLMNKALEVIEAHHLFNIDFDQIDVIIHRESIIHSMVEFVDGSCIAQLAMPDMRLPIQTALLYPEKVPSQIAPLNWSALSNLSFHKPDLDTFECFILGVEAGKIGGSMPAVMNKANEEAVQLFLSKEINFLEIPKYIKEKMQSHEVIKKPSLEDICNLSK
jgi:1-deoxy-D-xylulose-5-phosphate reductoisomerase